MIKLPVHRIIPFSNVEGLGNRTSIFVQGCNLNCTYCHNSETIPMKSKDTIFFSVDELVLEVKKNMPFIRGVTVSGGEATLYHEFLTEFFKEVKKLGITAYVDTNGFFDSKKIAELIEVTDKFLFDVKSDDRGLKQLCFTGSTDKPKMYQVNSDNMDLLLEQDKIEEIRLVYLKDTFDDEELMTHLASRFVKHPDVLFKIIRVHTRGLPKGRVNLIKKNVPTEKDMNDLVNLAKSKGIKNIELIL